MVAAKDKTLVVRVTSALVERIDASAEGSGLTRSNWVNAVLALAADKGLAGDWKPPAKTKGERRGKSSKKKGPA